MAYKSSAALLSPTQQIKTDYEKLKASPYTELFESLYSSLNKTLAEAIAVESQIPKTLSYMSWHLLLENTMTCVLTKNSKTFDETLDYTLQNLQRLQANVQKHLGKVSADDYDKCFYHKILLNYLDFLIPKFEQLQLQTMHDYRSVGQSGLQGLILKKYFDLLCVINALPDTVTKVTSKDQLLTRKKHSTTKQLFIDLQTYLQAYLRPYFDYWNPIFKRHSQQDIFIIINSKLKFLSLKNSFFTDDVLSAKLLKEPVPYLKPLRPISSPEEPAPFARASDTHSPFQDLFEQAYSEAKDASLKEIPFCLNIQELRPKFEKEFHINLVGCHGYAEGSWTAKLTRLTGVHAQQRVAEQMYLDNKSAPDLMIQAGDNAYRNGVCAFTDKVNIFYHHNYSLYGCDPFGIPILNMVCLGNHDYAIWSPTKRQATKMVEADIKNTSLQRAKFQIGHSYTSNRAWDMPNHYYIAMHDHFALVTIDSNTIMFDQAQQIWFVETIRKIKERFPQKWIIVSAHHPLVYIGKRVTKKNEWKMYVEELKKCAEFDGKVMPCLYQASEAQSTFTPVNPDEISHIGKFLLKLITVNKLPIDLWLCAHEHANAIHTFYLEFGQTIAQVISGGGGAHLNGCPTDNLPFSGSNNSSEILKAQGIRGGRALLIKQCYAYASIHINATYIKACVHTLSQAINTIFEDEDQPIQSDINTANRNLTLLVK